MGGTALALLVLLALALGPALTRIPRDLVQVGIGTLTLLFGMRWLRKAILRTAGVIALHDEDAAFAEETALLRGLAGIGAGWDRAAVSTAFKITMIEGIDVVFIVVALGTAGTLLCAFGTFWVGQGIGLHWPGEDLSLLGLITGFAGVARVAVRWCRAQAGLRTAAAGRLA